MPVTCYTEPWLASDMPLDDKLKLRKQTVFICPKLDAQTVTRCKNSQPSRPKELGYVGNLKRGHHNTEDHSKFSENNSNIN